MALELLDYAILDNSHRPPKPTGYCRVLVGRRRSAAVDGLSGEEEQGRFGRGAAPV